MTTTNKKVRCIDTNIVYESAQHASKSTGIHSCDIVLVCKKQRHKAGGFRWEYVDNTDGMIIAPIATKVTKSTKQTKVPTAFRVRNIETGEIFESAKLAGIAYKVDPSCIGKCCRGQQKSCKGYHWEYVPQNEIVSTKDILQNDKQTIKIKNANLNKKSNVTDIIKDIDISNNIKENEIQVNVQINNNTSQSIANYWIKKLIAFDTNYWFNKLLEDNHTTEEALDAEIHDLYMAVTDYENNPIRMCQDIVPVKINITISTKTKLSETIEYWAYKIISADVKKWVYEFLNTSEFKSNEDLDKYLEKLYNKVVNIYTTEQPK